MPKFTAIPAGFLLLLAASEPAVGAPEAPPTGEPASAQRAGPVAVLVELDGYDTDPTEVQLAVAKELGAAVTEAPEGASATVRVNAQKGGNLSVVVERPGQARLMRAVAAPGRDDEVAEAAALLAGNLARDEAAELLIALTPVAPAEPEPEPEPAVPVAATAEPTPLPWYPVNLSLFHPITVVPDSERARIGVELGLFYSRVGEISGAAFNPFVILVHGPTQGAEVAGVVGLNRGGGGGARVNGLVGWQAGAFEGATVSGLVTVSHGPHAGFLASGIASVQSSDFTGLQLAGAANVAGDVSGAQIAAGNVAGDVSGAQIGVVNVGGRVSGLQLGLVNVAEDIDGASIGIVTVSAKGRIQPVAWYSNGTPVNVGLRLYTGPLYAMPTLGFDQETNENGDTVDVLAPGFSLGARIPIARAFVDLDINYSNPAPELRYDEHEVDLRYRALVGFEVTDWVAPFLGGGVRHHFRTLGESSESFQPELSAGVQFF